MANESPISSTPVMDSNANPPRRGRGVLAGGAALLIAGLAGTTGFFWNKSKEAEQHTVAALTELWGQADDRVQNIAERRPPIDVSTRRILVALEFLPDATTDDESPVNDIVLPKVKETLESELLELGQKKEAIESKSLQELIELSKSKVRYCLPDLIRESLHLEAITTDHWCVEQEKRPYTAEGRRDWAMELISRQEALSTLGNGEALVDRAIPVFDLSSEMRADDELWVSRNTMDFGLGLLEIGAVEQGRKYLDSIAEKEGSVEFSERDINAYLERVSELGIEWDSDRTTIALDTIESMSVSDETQKQVEMLRNAIYLAEGFGNVDSEPLVAGKSYTVISQGSDSLEFALEPINGVVLIETTDLASGVDTDLIIYEGDSDEPLLKNDDSNGTYASSLGAFLLLDDQSYRLRIANIDSTPGPFTLNISNIEPSDDRWEEAVIRTTRSLMNSDESRAGDPEEALTSIIEWSAGIKPEFAAQLKNRLESGLDLARLARYNREDVPTLEVGTSYSIRSSGDDSVTFDLGAHFGMVEINTSGLSDEVDTTLQIVEKESDTTIAENDDYLSGDLASLVDAFLLMNQEYELVVSNIDSSSGSFELNLESVSVNPESTIWRESVYIAALNAANVGSGDSENSNQQLSNVLDYIREQDPEYADSIALRLRSSLNLKALADAPRSELPELEVGQSYSVLALGEVATQFKLKPFVGMVEVRTTDLDSGVDTTLRLLENDVADSAIQNDDDGSSVASLINTFLIDNSDYELTVANISGDSGFFDIQLVEITPESDNWQSAVQQAAFATLTTHRSLGIEWRAVSIYGKCRISR